MKRSSGRWYRAGHTIEDARDYGVVGCLEPNAQGKTFGSTFAVQFNGIKCVELALSNGIDNIFGYPSGIESGDPAGFQNFEDLWNAYDKQMRHFINQMVRGMEVLDRADRRNRSLSLCLGDGRRLPGEGPGPDRGRCSLQFHGRAAHGICQRGGQPVRGEKRQSSKISALPWPT